MKTKIIVSFSGSEPIRTHPPLSGSRPQGFDQRGVQVLIHEDKRPLISGTVLFVCMCVSVSYHIVFGAVVADVGVGQEGRLVDDGQPAGRRSDGSTTADPVGGF